MWGLRSDRTPAMAGPAVALGLLVLVWAATAGPVAFLSPSGRQREVDVPAGTASPDPSASQPTLEETTRDVEQTLDLSWLGDLIAWAVLLLLGAGVLVLGRLAWRHRWRRPEVPPEVEFDVLPAPRVARALSEDVDAHLDAVRGGTVRNGIVRCWLSLEESVGRAGIPRQRHETAAEFTVRVLHRLDLDPRAIGDLARLYREARFSEHELGEEARTAARSALERLHDDLRAAGAPR